jgi:streptomycin 3"-adenylyltransferase
VVVREKLITETKKAIISFILELVPDTPPKGLEFSVVLLNDTLHFTFPTPFELHYSPMWQDQYRAGQVDYETLQTDPDLAAHFTIIRTYGVCLYGEPITQVFGDVPAEDYWASISGDAEDILNNISANPVYSVLNLCRILAYKHEALILSKVDGGSWGLKNLDPRHHALIRQALEVYQAADSIDMTWDKQQLEDFAEYIRQQI